MIKTMGSIKALWISVCLTLVAFLHITGEVYADDYKPDIVGTLTKAGDSVKIENSNSYNIKYVKYVSSTDDLMYIYTDAEKNNVVVRVYDKNGRFIGEYDDLYSKDGQYIDPSNKKNPSNSEIFVKLKKGEVYYLATYINGSGDIVDYNINLIKATKKVNYP